ncbi:hypothetical protein JCM8547_002514 [Rhodosporidiobolus lusitaniae]
MSNLPSSADEGAPPPPIPSAQLVPASTVPAPDAAAAPAPPSADPPTVSSPPLARALSNLEVVDPAEPLLPPGKKRRSAAGVSVPASAPSVAAKGHRRTPSGRVIQDGEEESPLLRSSLAGVANGISAADVLRRSASLKNAGGGGASANGGANGTKVDGETAKEKEQQQPPRLSPIQTSTHPTSRSSPALPLELPSFPVLPPSQPAPNQTFQTPSQVSSILSLPPPLLLQLARADSPQEQRAIAERASAKSYLSSMAIPPPSPTTMVDNIQKAGLGMTPAASSSSSAPSAATAAPASSSTLPPAVPSSSLPSASPPLTAPSNPTSFSASLLSAPLSLPSLPSLISLTARGGHPALPLLLGQGFSPPTPGVLAPIPGVVGVGEAVRLAATGEDEGEGEKGGFRPKFASVEDWSVKAAREKVVSSHRSSSSSATPSVTAPSVVPTPTSPRPGLTPSTSFNLALDAREIEALAAQMKSWALAEQEKQVEQHVVEAKSAAVILAAQAAGAEVGVEGGGRGEGEGRQGEGGLDLSEYAEAYKMQLEQVASGYFAQLHRDALARLLEEEGEKDTTSSLPSGPSSSAAPTAAVDGAAPSPPPPTSTENREVMHVRASAAAAVAAQVMAAKDLARSAGERLVKLGADPRRVVEEVREVVEGEFVEGKMGGSGSRRGSSNVKEVKEVGMGMVRATSGGSAGGEKKVEEEEVREQDKMAVEDVGVVPALSSAGQPQPGTSQRHQQVLQHIASTSALAGSAGSLALALHPAASASATAADLASLPAAQAPPSASHALSRHASTSSRHAHSSATAPSPSSAAAAPHLDPLLPSPSSSLSSPSVLASVSSPQKRDYLLSYAHALYAKDAASEELLPLLHTIESMHPDHLPTLLLISCVYYTRGELESSLYYNKRLLEFDPSYVEAMSNIGTTLRAMGKWSEAEKWWWKAIKLRPTYWDATENLLGVLCNPTPHAPPPTAPTSDGADGAPPSAPRYNEALILCDYVESQIFALPASSTHPAVPSSSAAFINPLPALPRPRPLPPTVPFNHVHRLQNLFYAKGNLRLALGDHPGAQDEYEKAIEIALALPDWASHVPGMQYPSPLSIGEGCTTRDLVVAATVVGRILATYAQGGGGPEGAALIARTAAELGVADERGGVPFERIFKVVKRGGDAYVHKLLELGGGVLPTVLLEPGLIAQLPGMLFPESRGSLPALFDPALLVAANDPTAAAQSTTDPARKGIEQSAKQTTSTMLLTLAKILQDSLAPTSATRASVGGIPASQSLLLPLYYVALALYPSPSTCNNLGILLSTLTAATVIGSHDGSKPPTVLTGQQLALRYYQAGLKLDNRHPHLYTNLGSLLKDMGQLPQAVEMYKQAVQFNPTFDVALANLANAVKDTGNIQESIPYYQQAVRLNPNFPEAVCGLVNALGGVCDWQGRGGVGEEWLVNASKQLVHVPTPPGQQPPREGYMRQISDLVAKQLRDGASYGVGSLRSYGSLQDWLALIARALYGNATPDPAAMQLWASRLGFLLGDFDRKRNNVSEGGYLIRLIERLTRRIQRRWYIAQYGKEAYMPKGAPAPNRIVPSQGDLVNYRRPPLPPSLPPIPVPTVLPFHCFTLPVTARETRLISHRTGLRISHATLNQPWIPPVVYPPPRPPINGKINLGYVSSDLGNHPLSHLMQSVFGMHTSRFNVFVYATSPSDKSPYRQKIERESQNFVDCSAWSTQQIIDQIVKDEIHVLVNLSGYTKGARNEVFAARPAPVQMSYMGFASTLSAGWCDYFIVDPIVCPPHLVSGNQWRFWSGLTSQNAGQVKQPAPTDFEGDLDPEGESENFVYTEKLIYLPHSYFVTDHKQAWREDENVGLVPGQPPVTSIFPPSPEVTWALEEDKRLQMRRAMFPSIRNDTVIFANWNQLYKIDPFIFRIWLNILKKHPNSILWLLRFPAPGEAHLKDTAIRWAGEEVASRVVFTDVANKNDHIHRGRIADLFLDTTECNAHTTAADILWSGTPILTFPRHSYKMCSRVAASIAVATGYGDQMIVDSAEKYEARALELAGGLSYETVPADPTKPPTTLEGREQRRAKGELADLRKALFSTREQSPLFDTRRFVRNSEKGFITAWERWVSGAEFEDAPEWGHGAERTSGVIWVEDDQDGSNITQRQPYF